MFDFDVLEAADAAEDTRAGTSRHAPQCSEPDSAGQKSCSAEQNHTAVDEKQVVQDRKAEPPASQQPVPFALQSAKEMVHARVLNGGRAPGEDPGWTSRYWENVANCKSNETEAETPMLFQFYKGAHQVMHGGWFGDKRAPMLFLEAPSPELSMYIKLDPAGPFVGAGSEDWTDCLEGKSLPPSWEDWGFSRDKEKVWKADWHAVPTKFDEAMQMMMLQKTC